MSYWLLSVPHHKTNAGGALAELRQHTAGVAQVWPLDLPQLKVGTLDQLMALSEDTQKMDTYVGGVAKKIEKTYYELWKTEAAEQAAAKERSATAAAQAAASRGPGAAGAHRQSVSSGPPKDEKAPDLRIGEGNKSAVEYLTGWSWNDVRYPRRSPLRSLAELINKEANKSDEALKKQLGEFNEVRTSYTAMERKDAGTLLVKPLGPYVQKPPIETAHLTTLFIVVTRARQQEFMDTYETLEAAALVREAEEAKKKAAEAAERARKEAERRAQAEEKESGAGAQAAHGKTPAQLAAESARERERREEEEKQAEAARLEKEMQDPAAKKAAEEAARQAEEEEKRKNKKLPQGCNAVVPRSAQILSAPGETPGGSATAGASSSSASGEEFVLISVLVLKQGAEHYKNLLREKRFIVRPFKYDPAEDAAERERKQQLGQKKKQLWNFLIRWCTTSYSEIFVAWIHLKAIRIYVESVLRYGLPFNSQAALLEPVRGREKQARDILRQLYARLAGGNANLVAQLDPNETDLSGLGQDFYPYVYLPLQISD